MISVKELCLTAIALAMAVTFASPAAGQEQDPVGLTPTTDDAE